MHWAFREITFGSNEFRKECELRHEVLRAPIGLNLYDEDLAQEQQQMHFGLFDDGGELLACAVAVELSPTHARIRQMAVKPEHQRKGFGRRLLLRLEDLLARRGIVQFSLHARMTAVGFYEKLGYARSGPEFTEVGIPHVKMEKASPTTPIDPSRRAFDSRCRME